MKFPIRYTAIAALVLGAEPDEGESAFLAPADTREEESGTYREPCLKLLIGKEAYVLPMKEAVEIIRADDFSPVPGTPGFIKGLTLVREQSLLVVSAATLLGLGDRRFGDRGRLRTFGFR